MLIIRSPVVTVGRRFHAFSSYRKRSRIKVCILGAESAAGAPLAMLLQRSKHIDDLVLYGKTRPDRLAAELCCIPERPSIEAFGADNDGLYCALRGAQLVLLAEGAFRSSVKREQHFEMHVKSVFEYGKAIGAEVPNALVGVLTNPVSAMLPVVWESVRRSGGCQPSRRVMGVATLSAARVAAQAATVLNVDPATLQVYVGGGTSGHAVVPLLSALCPQQRLTQLEASAITASVAVAGGRVRRALQETSDAAVKSRPEDSMASKLGGLGGLGGLTELCMPTFSIAHAANKFADAAVQAIRGRHCVQTNAFVLNTVSEEHAEFSTMPIMLGRQGVLKILSMPTPSEGEAILLQAARELLRQDLALAKSFLETEYGPSLIPQKDSVQCPGYEGNGVSTLSDCRASLQPKVSPPCPAETLCAT